MSVPAETVRHQITTLLGAWGMPGDLAAVTAEAMLYADLAGIDSHGLALMLLYADVHRAGRMSLAARPRVVRENAVTALVDAGAGFGHPAGHLAMNLAVDKALACGIGAVSVVNSHHFGAAGYYAALAPPRGAIGLATTTSRGVQVLPARGASPVLGTNPIAFAAPAGRNPPFVLDMSTSTVAANKVRAHHFRGKPLPEGWVLDAAGRPVTDPARAVEIVFGAAGGGLTALGATAEGGGHKGYGLAAMVQILSAALSGGTFPALDRGRRGPDEPENIGHFLLAIDPRAFRPEGAFEGDVDALVDTLRATPPTDPDEPVLVPGDPETATRARRARDGIPVPAALADRLREVCAWSGVPFLLG